MDHQQRDQSGLSNYESDQGGDAHPRSKFFGFDSIPILGKAQAHIALILAQAGFAGFEILSRITLDNGAGKFAFSFYRNCVATLVLSVIAYYTEKGKWRTLSLLVTVNLFFLGLFGITLNQVFYLAGLEYTSPVFASAMRNTTPTMTFILAWIFRMEIVRLQNIDGVAKFTGCLFGILGSIFLSVYRGPTIIKSTLKMSNVEDKSSNEVHLNFFIFHKNVGRRLIGSIYLILSCFVFSSFLIIQAKLLKKFPAPFSCVTLMCLFSTLQFPLLCFLFEPGTWKWKITKSEVISIIYSGIIASGFVSGIQSWAIQQRGPVIVSAYQPLETILTGIFGFIFLQESLRMGSVLGGVIVIIGLYILIWGQSKHQKLIKQEVENNKPSEESSHQASCNNQEQDRLSVSMPVIPIS